jgi:hypothetical protein
MEVGGPASHPSHFTSGERVPGIHGKGGLQSWSGHGGEKKILCPHQELNPESPLVKLKVWSAYWLTHDGCLELSLQIPFNDIYSDSL